jgi:signal transduction histidine kinase
MKQIIENIIKFAEKYSVKTCRHESYLGGL